MGSPEQLFFAFTPSKLEKTLPESSVGCRKLSSDELLLVANRNRTASAWLVFVGLVASPTANKGGTLAAIGHATLAERAQERSRVIDCATGRERMAVCVC